MLLVVLLCGFIFTFSYALTKEIKDFNAEQENKMLNQVRKYFNIDVN